MINYGLSVEVFEKVQDVVRIEILYNQTALVEQLLADDGGIFTLEECANIYPDHSYDIECKQEYRAELEIERDEIIGKLDNLERDIKFLMMDGEVEEVLEENEKVYDLNARVVQLDNSICRIDEEIQELEGYQDTMNEPMEWYLVTNWLANKLKANGEVILDNDYGTWWGRTCTGQAIEADGVIHKIAKEDVNSLNM